MTAKRQHRAKRLFATSLWRLRHVTSAVTRGCITLQHRFIGRIRLTSKVLDVLAFVASFVALGCFAAHIGFDNDAGSFRHQAQVLRAVQGVFLTQVLFNLIFNFRDTRRTTKPLKWVVDIALLTTLLPLLYPHPAHPWIPWLERMLYGSRYLNCVLLVCSLFEVSRWAMASMSRRTNPALMLSVSFMVFIIIGAALLLLPKCTYYPISVVDSIFVSTSAVCITGLTTVDVATTFTPLGCTIIAVLIQIGALGVMTFTSAFALFYTGGNSIYSQLMVKDMVYTRSFSSLLPTILYILWVSLFIEAVGALLIWLSIHDTLPLTASDAVWTSVFHSISAFCNAGFSNIHGGLSNPLLLYGNQWIYLAMSIIIGLGSIGFPILVNLKEWLGHSLRRLLGSRDRLVHIWSMNSKLVITTTLTLYAAGVVTYFLCEYHNTLEGLPIADKLIQSFFNAVTPRSAGFSSFNPSSFMPVTLVTVMALMWIGGASQSTAGGIKVNTFAAIMLNIRAIITGKKRVTAYHRTISPTSMQRVQAVLALSIVTLLIYTVTLLALEPQLPVKDVVFEAVSAVFTVGSSMGITPMLCGASKIVLCTAMFIGRIGFISLLMGFANSHRSNAFSYPNDNIIIN
ncbi:MAG: potassium transporter [Candidatus Amulumruptor caecigallinarius]|nr:potassium transporter [Candidatus Amulumruptor caecigallinarius]MCM1395910.1 potassium transporter [Candidatus Amulumruptor caecigallinarius]MCM1452945.1 potassium transporter [bacterium]